MLFGSDDGANFTPSEATQPEIDEEVLAKWLEVFAWVEQQDWTPTGEDYDASIATLEARLIELGLIQP